MAYNGENPNKTKGYSNMRTKFFEIAAEYQARYTKILDNYYPAHKSTGFTERNQSVNFTGAIESLYPGAFTWYEAPIGAGYKEHFDAVTFDTASKKIFIIESKRFSNPEQKLESVGRDIERIMDEDNIAAVCEHLSEKEKYTKYGVILADVWLETAPKKEIAEHWEVEDFFEAYSNKLKLSREVKNPQFWQCGFPQVENYRLLALLFDI
ncbi:MAG: hypothetical protein LBN99_05525 [Oscillospiraceae bacterium]|jgi:hypothetical protein|nr:hypothetical protein [Oscillospiraceae bacterium]